MSNNGDSKPGMPVLQAIVCDELAAMAERSEQAGRAHDAQIVRLALALIAPPPPLQLQPSGEKRGRGRPRKEEVPASVADLGNGKGK